MATIKQQNFKSFEIKEASEPELTGKPQDLKVDRSFDVREFSFDKIYKKIPGVFDSLGQSSKLVQEKNPAKDDGVDRMISDPNQIKNASFHLHSLLRNAKSVETEVETFVRERVEERVKLLQEDAYKEGFKKGYEDGKNSGYLESSEATRKDLKDRIDFFEKLIEEFENARRMILENNEKFIIEMISRISRRVTLNALKEDRDYVIRLATDLISNIDLKENVKILIHERDMGSVDRLRESLIKRFQELKNVTIEQSPKINRGGLILKTDFVDIDARLETQLDRIEEALVGKSIAEPPKPTGEAT